MTIVNLHNKKLRKNSFGLGLRQSHIDIIKQIKPKNIDFFEIISENYFNENSFRRYDIEELRRDYPFFMHGVSLSIGSPTLPSEEYLKKLRNLANWLQPKVVSDHFCWTGLRNFNSHDLLPLAYDKKSLKIICNKIDLVQNYLKRPIALENPSTYLEFDNVDYDESEFILKTVEKSGCMLLLDINNVFVNCCNHGYNAEDYLSKLPHDSVVQMHIAGHTNYDSHIIDTHATEIGEGVLELYKYYIKSYGCKPTMIERDDNIPPFQELSSELNMLRNIAVQETGEVKSDNDYIDKLIYQAAKNAQNKQNNHNNIENIIIKNIESFQDYLLSFGESYQRNLDELKNNLKENSKIPRDKQAAIYYKAYRNRLFSLIEAELPASRKFLQDNFFKLIRSYIEYKPSKYHSIEEYIYELPAFAEKYLDALSLGLLQLEIEISKVKEVTDFDSSNNQNNDIFLDNIQQIDANILRKIEQNCSSSFVKFAYDVNEIYNHLLFDDEISKNYETPKQTLIILQKQNGEVFKKAFAYNGL